MKVEIKEALEGIYERDGVLHPVTVLDEAADPEHPLHGCFTWDDSEAARQHRLNQARQLIRVAVTVIPSLNSGPVRQFVSISSMRKTGTGSYLAMIDVVSDEARYQQMLQDALTTLVGFERRYRHIRELGPVFSAIAALVTERAAA